MSMGGWLSGTPMGAGAGAGGSPGMGGGGQGELGDGGGDAAPVGGGGRVLVSPPFGGVPDRRRGGVQQRVDRGGEVGGEGPPGVVVGAVGLLVGQQHPPPVAVEGGEEAGGD